MISGIVRQENMVNVPAAEIKNRKFSEAQKAEAQKAEDKQQKEINAQAYAKDENVETKEAMGRIEEAAVLFNRKIRLELEEDLDIMIVKVVDSETEEVIRQIPPEELVELSKNAKDLKGLLINKEG
ncbi:MAG: flagellar protein FlaG [Nitrospirae bacterium]|nr:flagellar protein FlaG [Nitrospirota bacterium]